MDTKNSNPVKPSCPFVLKSTLEAGDTFTEIKASAQTLGESYELRFPLELGSRVSVLAPIEALDLDKSVRRDMQGDE